MALKGWLQHKYSSFKPFLNLVYDPKYIDLYNVGQFSKGPFMSVNLELIGKHNLT